MKQILYDSNKELFGKELKRKFGQKGITGYAAGEGSDALKTTQLGLATLVDYYKRKMYLFFYLKGNAEIADRGDMMVEIEMKIHLDQYGPDGMEPAEGYQNLLLNLF